MVVTILNDDIDNFIQLKITSFLDRYIYIHFERAKWNNYWWFYLMWCFAEDKVCKFGNMTMHIGDELDKGTNYDSLCVKCVCEVPPIPTCRRLPDSECDINYAYPSIKLL